MEKYTNKVWKIKFVFLIIWKKYLLLTSDEVFVECILDYKCNYKEIEDKNWSKCSKILIMVNKAKY